ncbi:citrate synthase/methylcitrate synthase [Neobacillus sp. MM2021_6]|uniref:citrate synthase/methylcitrate synthase n=1 Tax=Bacillaceae TaxID=186817 RepID=UPI001409A4DF|nr:MULTISPECIES: citrate synthase/methylcitrate synthase [Bacillaceae]MBO0959730.1 citrate synthase/methylcitrate synthase [Neobacillus sp. MM2021_6]NHC19190.1 citrate synthase/methylcitrate synthase [Bacillus sp. MM2020_4]
MIQKGLKGIVAAETFISHIDGENGKLFHRGYDIKEMAKNFSFEEASYLLWFGHFPNTSQLAALKKDLKGNRELPEYVKGILHQLPRDMELMSVIRTAISAEGGYLDYGWKPSVAQAIRLTALVPTIIAYRKSQLDRKVFVSPRDDLDHVENYLYMLSGKVPSPAHVEALETYMILTIEHGMNASTFSARVTASTESDLVSAITSAIGTMKGPLHGGAPLGVIELLDEIALVGDPEMVIRGKVLRGEKLMGFGHRVYKTHDPRAIALKAKLMDHIGVDEWLDLAMSVEDTAIRVLAELKPGRSLYTNVEYYAAAIMKAINMDAELFTPTFTASRMVGWTAHVLEQAENNTIYRPQSKYIGTFN